MSLLKNIGLSSASKPYAGYCGSPVAAGMRWRLRRQQITPRQQFRLVCDTAVRQAFTEAKQRYGAPRLADELPEYNVKTIAASLRRQGLRANRCAGSSARSDTANMACRCLKIC